MTARAQQDGVTAQAEALFRSGNHAAAAALLAPLAEAESPDPTALRLLGLCRLQLGQVGEALALLGRARSLAPDDPWAAMHLGLGLHAAGRSAEAAPLFRLAQGALAGDPAPSINLASALLATGDAPGALRAASEACHRAPGLAAAHYTYGLGWLANHEPARAAEAFSAALRLAPGFADAWVNLGLARYRGLDLEGAKHAMRQALAAAPGHRAATANLAAFLRLAGSAEAAEAMLRELLARDPGAVEARLNLAADLLLEERPAEALALLDGEPLAGAQARHHWLAQRALALLQLHRPAEAAAVLDAAGEPPVELVPLMLWRRVLIALAGNDAPRARDQADAMAAALDGAGDATLPEHRIMARFDLAKFWSGQREPDRAFPHWAEGHRQLGRFQPFSREAYRAFVDASIAGFSRTRLLAGPRAANRDPAPVFIVGLPRSGTTLCEQILAAHHDVHGAGERPALGDTFERLGGGADTPLAAERVAGLDSMALDDAATDYLAALHALAPGAGRVVDKMPGNLRHLGLVGLMLPGARIIHCVRDPRDIGLSIFTFRFHGHHAYAHDLGDLGWYIGQQERLMRHWRDAAPNPILAVALPDWVEDFAGTLTRVLRFLDLPDDPACARFYEADGRVRTVSRAQVRQPVNARGLGRWKAYERHLAPLIAELSAAGLVETTLEHER